MTPEQNLIQQITRVIENNQLEKNSLLEEMAAQYSELCSEVNTRLLRCAEYLQKGLLSEAVYEAGWRLTFWSWPGWCSLSCPVNGVSSVMIWN